jgi:uncharacterized protein (TIGR00296 family)
MASEPMKSSEGKKALEIARKTINLWILKGEKYIPEKYPESFNEKAGVFTTIHTYPGRKLRGCIGYPEPFMPLIRSLINSAIHATKDPRFEPLKEEELDKIIVEVSILTRPKRLKVKKPEDYLQMIKIGRHGLIVRKWSLSGLLLPQVATEHGMDSKTFLEHTCMKAYLPMDAWQDPATSVYCFESHIFSEKKPPKKIETE